MRTFVLGDIHGKWPLLNKFIKTFNPCTIIQVGDFGWFSPPNLNTRDSIIYFIDGNHENHDFLQKFTEPTELVRGVTYLPRGTHKTIGGYSCLFMGGASSIDAKYRTPGYDWFPEEIISDQNIRAIGNIPKVDIIFSHTVPEEFEVRGHFNIEHHDPSRKQLSYLLNKYKPQNWFAGHWHKYQRGTYNNTNWTVLGDIPNVGFYDEL